jgi:hypothetical protein
MDHPTSWPNEACGTPDLDHTTPIKVQHRMPAAMHQTMFAGSLVAPEVRCTVRADVALKTVPFHGAPR